MMKEVISYFFELHGQKTFLFEIPVLLSSEKQCLDLYEKGLKRGYFKMDRSSLNQQWVETCLWGWLGRCEPVDLVRILCAHGGHIRVFSNVFGEGLMNKSFKPVHFQIEMNQNQHEVIQNVLSVPLGENTGVEINPFLYLEDKKTLCLGSYFLYEDESSDSSFPVYFKKVEKDLCLQNGSIQEVLSKLFFLGFEIDALEDGKKVILAFHDIKNQTIRGYDHEETLFYLGELDI